ncbi:MAG: hypothetical protein LH481_13615 [Burkholderiales bacterium]|nr:hypothetical protein [Burkholderiales bacterium]
MERGFTRPFNPTPSNKAPSSVRFGANWTAGANGFSGSLTAGNHWFPFSLGQEKTFGFAGHQYSHFTEKRNMSLIEEIVCEKCQATFRFSRISRGMADLGHRYCNLCGKTALLDSYKYPAGVSGSEIDWFLAPCSCGGRFESGATPRCPECNVPLTAADFLLAGENWSGHRCIVVNDNVVSDNWVKLDSGELEA